MNDMLSHFGLDRDPFEWAPLYESGDVKRIRRAVRAALADRAWIAVVGSPGAGKSFALREVLADADCHMVSLISGNRRTTTSAQIDESFFLALGDERARRSREARRHQLRRILGEAVQRRPVLLHIDESTCVHDSLLTEIKFLRDVLRFGSDPRNPRRQDPRPLFGVLLVGWLALADRIRRSDELRPRIRLVQMEGFARSEVAEFVAHLGLAKVCGKRVVDAIADRCRFPLEIVERLRLGLERAWLRGAKALAPDDVALDETDLFLLARRLNIGPGEIAKDIGYSAGAVSQAMNGYKVSRVLMDKIRADILEKAAARGGQAREAEAQAV